MTTGLVVGKFCPLHKGHEALIAFARARCDRLVILSYTKPEFPGCSAEQRSRWLAGLFPDVTRLVLDDTMLTNFAAASGGAPPTLPHNDAAEEDHRAFCAWVCQVMLNTSVQRVFTSEAYGDGFAASLSRHFGHRVEHVCFDPARAGVPISGTQMRADPRLHRLYLSEPVRRSLVRRVALIGGESSGKTTLAGALARKLGTVWVPEYGRELWDRKGGVLEFDDLLAIGREQVAREEAALSRAESWLVCDTNPLVTEFYSEAMFGRVAPPLRDLAKRTYDHLFICAPDFPFVQDGTRQDPAFRDRQHEWYVRRLAEDRIEASVLTGSLTERVAQAAAHLRRLDDTPMHE